MGFNRFIRLRDTPDSYSGQTGKYPKVKSDETGLEFAIISFPLICAKGSRIGPDYVNNTNLWAQVDITNLRKLISGVAGDLYLIHLHMKWIAAGVPGEIEFRDTTNVIDLYYGNQLSETWIEVNKWLFYVAPTDAFYLTLLFRSTTTGSIYVSNTNSYLTPNFPAYSVIKLT